MGEPKLIYLVLYAIAMTAIAIRVVRKKNNFIYCCMWIAYAVCAVFSLLCKLFQPVLVGTGIMHYKWYDLSDTTFHGYVLIIVCCLIAFRPFKLFDHKGSLEEIGRSKGIKQFYTLFSYAYILWAVIFIVLSLNTVFGLLRISDFGLVRTTLFGNAENESEFVMTTNFVANICYKLCLQFKLLNVLIALSMIKEKFKTGLAVFSMLCTFLIYYLYATGNAARGGLLIFTFCCILIGVMLFKYMQKSSRRKVFIFASIAIVVVISFFITVTVSRFSSGYTGANLILSNISFYLGHAPIEFSKITGSLDHFAYGKTILGRLANHYFGTPYSWSQVSSQIGYPDIGAVFVTYLGYMYTDFGSIGCIIFVSLWSWFMCGLIKRSPNRISTMFLFLYYLQYYVTGLFAVGRLEYAAMITAHIIFFVIRLAEDVLRQQGRRNMPRYVYSNGSYRRM